MPVDITLKNGLISNSKLGQFNSLTKIYKAFTFENTSLKFEINNEYKLHIFKALLSGLQSEWFKSLSNQSKFGYLQVLTLFIPWLNKQDIKINERYSVLKDFETYRIVKKRVKPQSTGINVVIALMKHGMHNNFITYDTTKYISTLIKSTTISIVEQRSHDNLTTYFSSMPWLRNVIGETSYLKLESPKRLLTSFSVTISSLLLLILHAKEKAREKIISTEHFIISKEKVKGSRDRNQLYCQSLLNNLGVFDVNGSPDDLLTELLIQDFVPEDRRQKLINQRLSSSKASTLSYRCNIDRLQFFTLPNIFKSESWSSPSELEQILFSWICSVQMIQPSDIAKLKITDFAISKNNEDRPVAIQCIYYKGRANRLYEPPMLDARSIEARALLAYISQASKTNTKLVTSLKVGPTPLSAGPTSIFVRLLRLLNSKLVEAEITKNLKYRNSSSLFSKALLGMSTQKMNAYDKWSKGKLKSNQKSSAAIYRNEIQNPLPISLFGLRAIKNTAVHSNADKYRENDLINQNSHTSKTEKINYLNDSNKDWINQNGRITRMVLHDIEQYVFRPNLDLVQTRAYDLKLRTRVIEVLDVGITENQSFSINQLGFVDKQKFEFDQIEVEPDDIIVLDTAETVVNMLHYVNEAKRQRNQLINHALSFFEETILPTVEWMESILNQSLSPKTVKNGQILYLEIAPILPQLFKNELSAGVG